MQDSVTNMINDVVFVRDTATAFQVALEMLRHNRHQIPVVDSEQNLIGIISVDDLYSAENDGIKSLIKEPELVIPDDVSTYEAVSRMKAANAICGLVTSGSKLAGMFTWRDLLSEFTHR